MDGGSADEKAAIFQKHKDTLNAVPQVAGTRRGKGGKGMGSKAETRNRSGSRRLRRIKLEPQPGCRRRARSYAACVIQ